MNLKTISIGVAIAVIAYLVGYSVNQPTEELAVGGVTPPCNARQGQVVDAVTGKYELLCTNGRISIIDPEDQKLMTPEQRVADSISKINAAIPDVDKDISFDETGKFLNVRILNNEVN